MGKTQRYRHPEYYQALKDSESNKSDRSSTQDYSKLDGLDGRHPWMKQVPEGFISYPVRKLRKGSVAYFNYNLAKEMGIISKTHRHKMNAKLEKKILDTFSLRIINEYDQLKKVEYKKSDIKDHEFMATRYLQLQHDNKQGKTSGDGRGIWNGTIRHGGKTWDVSSRGTGVTSLAPGAVKAGKPLCSGNTQFGYGCGLAEIDELYSSAILAEIFHNSGINTERMLAVIDLGGGIGIGVRAGQNLFRPAHFFLHLKQENYNALKRSTDFFIERQTKNGDWSLAKNENKRYQQFLDEMCHSFAKFVAQLERDYIFAWLDWDGDNVLGNAGIIDYGSVRMLGLRHDHYRYDDVERFSTSLNEQKSKARLTIQVFAQMTDYLITKEKKSLVSFRDHPVLKKFDDFYDNCILERLLEQIGFTRIQTAKLLKDHKRKVTEFYKIYSNFERTKTSLKPKRVPDGINKPAVYNMRRILRLLPEHLTKTDLGPESLMDPKTFMEIISSEFVTKRQSKLTPAKLGKITKFQKSYLALYLGLRQSQGGQKALIHQVAERTKVINREDRVTGNALLHITNEIIKYRKSGLTHQQIQFAMDNLIARQTFIPEQAEPHPVEEDEKLPSETQKLVKNMFKLVDGYKEDI